MMTDQRTFTVDQAARRLKVKRHHIFNMIRDGDLEAERVDGKWIVGGDSLRRMGERLWR